MVALSRSTIIIAMSWREKMFVPDCMVMALPLMEPPADWAKEAVANMDAAAQRMRPLIRMKILPDWLFLIRGSEGSVTLYSMPAKKKPRAGLK